MTSSSRRRLSSFTTYEQRRRRSLRLGSSASLISLQGRAHSDTLRRDVNNNQPPYEEDSGEKQYLVGAIIYKICQTAQEESQLALHVFEKHRVRHTEPESQVLKRIDREYSAVAIGKTTFISNLFMTQKYVPVHYSSQFLGQLEGDIRDPSKQRFQVQLQLRRKYVSVYKYEYHPTEEIGKSESKVYRSFTSLNVF
ncbi:uncharacterized protein LOC131685164 isoform X2 [Topomyia yanbarensis]|uniref:uncharacterized protein LOC131685164 isoform X2 n=1 Tax=Topomyia yanbarensis TaxID=2498891 RepID=UPI00273B7B64|nr:uncharacterized protein LOC131685164 isoform X2 [Topomyia yanbarensis]